MGQAEATPVPPPICPPNETPPGAFHRNREDSPASAGRNEPEVPARPPHRRHTVPVAPFSRLVGSPPQRVCGEQKQVTDTESDVSGPGTRASLRLSHPEYGVGRFSLTPQWVSLRDRDRPIASLSRALRPRTSGLGPSGRHPRVRSRAAEARLRSGRRPRGSGRWFRAARDPASTRAAPVCPASG